MESVLTDAKARGVKYPALRGTRQALATLDSRRTNLAYEVTDNILCSLPLSPHYGQYQMLMAVGAGANLVVEKTSSAALSLMDSIERHPVSVVPCVADSLAPLHGHATRRGIAFPGVRLVSNGGAGLRRRRISRMNNLFPHARICNLYGLPKCKCCACLPPRDVRGKPGSLRHLRGCDGVRVNPLDREQFLLAPDGVQDAVVVGIADADRGRAPWAFVVVKPNQRTADVGELLEHCRAGLASWQLPVGITEKKPMPTTGSGRVDLVLLQERACKEQAAVAQ